MPLTRNLYEIDECVSALQLCLRNGWPRALFWLWELVVSCEEDLALTTLTDSWLYWGGGYDPYWRSASTWVERCLRLQAAIKAAGSLNAMRFLDLTAAMPERPTMTPRPATAKIASRRAQKAAAFVASLDPEETISHEDAANFWISFDAACRQHSRIDAFWLLQAAQHYLSVDAIWTALELMGHTAPRASAKQLLYQAAATLSLCTPSADRASADLSYTAAECDWAAWTANVGRRSARLHAIPVEALHTETTRGQTPFKYTNIGDVRDPLPLLSEGCAFWQEALKAHGITVDEETGATEMPNDTVLETFYDRYFPDDIPDEWSKQDQEKSHGRGCQEKAGAPPSPVQIREEPVERRAWNCGIHVRP